MRCARSYAVKHRRLWHHRRVVTVLALLGVLAVLFVAAAVATREGEVLVPAPPDRADLALPVGRPVRGDDVDGLRFGMALRGYRMSEVDDVLDRVAEELRERDARLARLEAQLAASGDGQPAPDGAEPLPDVEVRPGAHPPAPVPFPEPVHVDEPVDVPPPDPQDAAPSGSRRVW